MGWRDEQGKSEEGLRTVWQSGRRACFLDVAGQGCRELACVLKVVGVGGGRRLLQSQWPEEKQKKGLEEVCLTLIQEIRKRDGGALGMLMWHRVGNAQRCRGRGMPLSCGPGMTAISKEE